MSRRWTRRAWLGHQTVAAVALVVPERRLRKVAVSAPLARRPTPRHALTVEQIAPGLMQTLALQAVDAARTAGAQYADARLTRTVAHRYTHTGMGNFGYDDEEVGVGVRVLVNGYWGFAASPYWAEDEVARLARDAVALATANARGPARAVEWKPLPAVTGTWTTPIRIDPFGISIEEKLDHIAYWHACAQLAQTRYQIGGGTSWMMFVRQERVLATSEGSLVTQTLYETGGKQLLQPLRGDNPTFTITGIDWAGQGWERFLDAKISDQFAARLYDALARSPNQAKPARVGRYTLVCDGATMATLVGATLGPATQLDRALGYEANAGGTSFLDDPLGMLGTFKVASPLVTMTANRSAPAQLATVQWDDEGVVPSETTLVKDGVLHDFQTTRESAEWLAPYYQRQKAGQPVRSNGCAAAENALNVTLQHMPNLELLPVQTAVRLEDLVADVKDGILVEHGTVFQMDSQVRNGVLGGPETQMREIKNGRLGPALTRGYILFNSLDLWKHVNAIGGHDTQATLGWTGYDIFNWNSLGDPKGQPTQHGSYSVRAAAATIPNQPVIDIGRKA